MLAMLPRLGSNRVREGAEVVKTTSHAHSGNAPG
eukprot:COSAG05_NODE_11573_length_506_cov_4.004914_1_plen_33_part_10